jgi:catechol 2,3-dioxygenase-like lactoylglutathione lyase family enzyme
VTIGGSDVDVQFITSIALVAADPPKTRQLFLDAIGLPLAAGADGAYYHSERIEGSKHFAIWPLSQAANACFGVDEWPSERVVPQVSIEFEVHDAESVASAAGELKAKGYELLHEARDEPWGQTVARLLTIDGSIIGISYAPSLHTTT